MKATWKNPIRSGAAISVALLLVVSLVPLAGPAQAVGTFDDDDGNIHESAIENIAGLGITFGCNPPANNLYCPDDYVTRQQMASFLVRTFDLPAGPDGQFSDIAGSVHASDINALAASGITRGCNPPQNTNYCPTDLVTRGQMAAFMARGLNLEPATQDFFSDDDNSIFEAQINAIARVGITRGCNPPQNTDYCPDQPVRRDEMASFLTRVHTINTTGTTQTTTPGTTPPTTGPTTTRPGETTTSSTLLPPTTTTTQPPPTNVGPWESVNDGSGPTARHENGFVQMGGKLFLIGGRGTRPVEEWDPARGEWITRSASTTDVHHFQPVVYDGKIYLMGELSGSYPTESPLSTVRYYDPNGDAIVNTGHSIPADRRRGAAGAVEHGGYIYLVGGITQGHGDDGGGTTTDWLDRYDPRTGQWQKLAGFQFPRDHFQAAVVGDRIWVIGGRRGDQAGNGWNDSVLQVEYYNIDANKWTTLPASKNLPTPRSASMVAVIDSAIYVIGGEGSGNAYQRVDRFDTNTLTWEQMPNLNPARHGTGAAVCSRNIYVAAGSTRQGEQETNAFHVLDPDGDGTDCELIWTSGATTPSLGGEGDKGRSEAMAAAPDGNMYVMGGYTAWSPRMTTPANHVYVPQRDEWKMARSMPDEIHATHIGTTTDGRFIFLAGGYQHLCSVLSLHPGASCPNNREIALYDVWRYDSVTDDWSQLPSLPQARGSGGLALIGNTLHYFGGTDSGTTNATRVEKGDHWTLNLPSGSWQNTGDPMPTPLSHFGTAVLDGAIYAVGGQTGAEGGAAAKSVVQRYHNGSWSTRASLPDNLSHHSSTTFVLAGHIITVGGETGHHQPTSRVFDYSPMTNDWVELTELPVATQAGAGSVINGVFYIAGGGGTPDFKRNTWIGSYD